MDARSIIFVYICVISHNKAFILKNKIDDNDYLYLICISGMMIFVWVEGQLFYISQKVKMADDKGEASLPPSGATTPSGAATPKGKVNSLS